MAGLIGLGPDDMVFGRSWVCNRLAKEQASRVLDGLSTTATTRNNKRFCTCTSDVLAADTKGMIIPSCAACLVTCNISVARLRFGMAMVGAVLYSQRQFNVSAMCGCPNQAVFPSCVISQLK